MRIFGKVVAILDETRLLVQLDTFLAPGSELTVFAAVEREELKKIGLEKLLIPKGRIQVSVQQNEDLYLASRFTEVRNDKVAVLKPLEYLMTPARWSADFDTSRSLGVEFDNEITIDDPVGER